ncbi:hypothetical protein Bca101_101370 [Brassica carinata]
MYPNQASYKWDNFFMPTPMRFIQLPGDSRPLYWDNFFMPTPMRFIQLPGDSPPLYVSKSSFLQSDSSWFDWRRRRSCAIPKRETGITRFESGITSSCQLL